MENQQKQSEEDKITVRLGDLADDLQNYCTANDKKRSEVAREAIKMFINKQLAPNPLDQMLADLDKQIEAQKKELLKAKELLEKTEKLNALKEETVKTLKKTKDGIKKTL